MSLDPDWVTVWATVIMAFAAFGSFAVAVLLWKVTSKYTAETKEIAEANKLMAAANSRMMLASESLLDEMRADRKHFHTQRSVDAAHRLTAALTSAGRAWREAEDDVHYGARLIEPGGPPPTPITSADEKRRQAYTDWWTAQAVDADSIAAPALVEDLKRFTNIFGAATFDWDAIVWQAEGDDGDPSHPPPSRPDSRSGRLRYCERKLVGQLAAHRRGEQVDGSVLPRDAWQFLGLPPGHDAADFEALAHEAEAGEETDGG